MQTQDRFLPLLTRETSMSTTNLPQRTSYNGGAEKPKQIKSRSGKSPAERRGQSVRSTPDDAAMKDSDLAAYSTAIVGGEDLVAELTTICSNVVTGDVCLTCWLCHVDEHLYSLREPFAYMLWRLLRSSLAYSF